MFARKTKLLAVLICGVVLIGCSGGGGSSGGDAGRESGSGTPGAKKGASSQEEIVERKVEAPPPDIEWFTSNQEANTFQISTAAQLAGLARLVNEDRIDFGKKTIVLGDNIDLSVYGVGSTFNAGKGWIPIGRDGKYPFTGIFDGDNKTIKGLSCTPVPPVRTLGSPPSQGNGWGLFGLISGGTIKNLGIVDLNITSYGGGFDQSYGGIVGFIGGGDIINCYTTGSINIRGGGGIGGVAGVVMGGSVIDCFSTSAVKGPGPGKDYSFDVVGGVVGKLEYAGEKKGNKIFNCYSTGLVYGTRAGGVVGDLRGVMNNCYSTGEITGGAVGGVVVEVGRNSVVADCYSTGAVSGKFRAGGVVASAGIVRRCYSIGAVVGGSSVGGVAGSVDGVDARTKKPDFGLSNCAALNPSVVAVGLEGEEVWVGRVSGGSENTKEKRRLSNNVAISNMTIKRSRTVDKVFTKGIDKVDGGDISIDQILSDGTIGGRFKVENGWTVENGKLPGLLGKAVDVPAHLK